MISESVTWLQRLVLRSPVCSSFIFLRQTCWMNLEDSILIELSKIYIATPYLKQNTNLPTLWKENKEEATLATMYTVPQTHL